MKFDDGCYTIEFRLAGDASQFGARAILRFECDVLSGWRSKSGRLLGISTSSKSVVALFDNVEDTTVLTPRFIKFCADKVRAVTKGYVKLNPRDPEVKCAYRKLMLQFPTRRRELDKAFKDAM